MLELPFLMARRYEELGVGDGAEQSDVQYRPSIGWRLRSKQDNDGQKRMLTGAASGILGTASWTIADSHEFEDTFVQDPDGNYNAGAAAFGDAFLFKKGAAGDPLEQRLSSDQTSLPTPFPESDAVPMDRIAVSSFSQNPFLRRFTFTIQFPANSNEKDGCIGTFYFAGPSNTNVIWNGTGYHAIKIWTDGYGELFEYGWNGGVWIWRYLTRFDFQNGLIPNGRWFLGVEIMEDSSSEYPYGGLLVTTTKAAPSTSPQPGFLGKTAGRGSALAHGASPQPIWACEYFNDPPIPPGPPGADLSRLRIDAPRNSRPGYQVVKHTYLESGHLTDGIFRIDSAVIGSGAPFVVVWYGKVPTDTSITVRMFRADTGAELTGTIIGDFMTSFPCVAGIQAYRVRFDFASDGESTPTLHGYKVVRDGQFVTVDPGEFEAEVGSVADLDEEDIPTGTGFFTKAAVADIDITQPGVDPSVAVSSFTVKDMLNVHGRLASRGVLTSRIETEYDPADPAKRCVLHRGYAIAPIGTKPPSAKREGYGSNRTTWRITSAGVYDQLRRALSPGRFDWGAPDEDATPVDGVRPPYKATDAIRDMLTWCGFPSSMIDIPDLPLRLFVSNGSDFYIEKLAPVDEFIQRIARKYLGMRLVFCENSGLYGKWKLLAPTTPPYTYLAHFTTDRPPAGHAPHVIESYPPIGGRPVVPVRPESINFKNIPLEGNRIIVTASGSIGGMSGDAMKMTAIWHNFKSFNFLNLAPSHQHYPDPDHPDYCPNIREIVYVDPGLWDPNADGRWVKWALRRVVSVAGHTVRTTSFVAPLVLIDDPFDPDLVGKKRILRYYDAVTYNGQPVLVRSCDPFYDKDGHQYARYTVEAPREDYL